MSESEEEIQKENSRVPETYSSIWDYPERLKIDSENLVDKFLGLIELPGEISSTEAEDYISRTLSAVHVWAAENNYEVVEDFNWQNPSGRTDFEILEGGEKVADGRIKYYRGGKGARISNSPGRSGDLVEFELGYVSDFKRAEIKELEEWVEAMSFE